MSNFLNIFRNRRGLVLGLMLVIITFSCKDDEDADKPNQAPVIEDQNFSINENSPDDTVIGTILATDPDGDDLTFRITDGNVDDVVSINASNGELRVNNTTALDFETNPTLTLAVEVSDGEAVGNAVVTISITDQQENTPPVIEQQEFAIDENSEAATEVGTVQATDAEQTTLSFSITDGNVGDAFEIDENTGVISIAAGVLIDFEITPAYTLSISVSDGQVTSNATVTINVNDIAIEPITTESQLNTMLSESYTSFHAYVELLYILDAVYANTSSAPTTDWDNLHAHSQNSLDEKVAEVWNGAFEIIYDLNNIIENAATILTDNQAQEEVISQSKAMRGYLYFQLVSWFGNLPLETSYQPEVTTLANSSSVIDFVNLDLSVAIEDLPDEWMGADEGNLTKGFAKALQMRVYLYNGDFSNALTSADEFQTNMLYELDDNHNDFSTNSTEIIDGFDQTGDNIFATFFQKGNYVPVFRLTEAFLVDAEANTNQGNLADAITVMDELRLRAGEASVTPGISQPNLLALVFDQWQSEMAKEGVSFQTMKRFGRATTDLIIEDFKLLLPIPQEVIDNNPGFFQNAGY